MKNGKALNERFAGGTGRGLPWFVVTDAAQKPLATSDGPDGNIGCPVTPEEAEVFFEILVKTRSRLTDADLAVLRAEHAAFAKPILEKIGR
jgi:hypothetical protein